jgi:hypothetical protein
LRSNRETPRIPNVRRMVNALAVILLVLTGCSSDAAPLPEPDLRQAGAFVAVGQGELTLLRTLKSLTLDSDTLILATVYDVTPSTFEQAREISQQKIIPIRQGLDFRSENLLRTQPHRVVWFRTLTQAEEDLSL